MIRTADEMRDFREKLNTKYMRKVKMGHCTKEEVQEQTHIFEALVTAEEALRELHRYNLLKEHGRLIELPCKVGDTVYEIYRFCIYGAWEIDEHRVTLEDLPHIGKTVFTTKEEAEAKLKELKGESK